MEMEMELVMDEWVEISCLINLEYEYIITLFVIYLIIRNILYLCIIYAVFSFSS